MNSSLQDSKATYEPGKRHWLKVKKDYLNEGAMADTADLVALGGWYGTGNKVGHLSDKCFVENAKKFKLQAEDSNCHRYK